MEEDVKEVKKEKGWGSGILVGLLVGIVLFVLTYQLLLMAK
jgi:tetrahydromethanopterin S-methyltransferase subunit G